MRRRVTQACLLLVAALLAVAPVTPAQADQNGLVVTATVGGATLHDAGSNSPIVLRPNDSTVVVVHVTNNGNSPVDVRAVRLNARVLGLAFFSYTTRVDLTLTPGATGTRTFALDLTDLDGQATGLLPAQLSLLAPDRTVLYSEKGTVDVKGKLRSVYGVFGLAVGAITLLLLLSLLLRLVRRTLPDSRLARAVRFAVPGLGLGLVVTFTLGAVRVLVPSTTVAVGLLVGGLVVGFVLGYLTPTPSDEADRDELDERDVVAVPVYTPPPVPAQAPPAPAPAVSAVDDDPRQTRVVGPPPPPSA